MISYSQRAIRRDADHHENQPVLLDPLDDRNQTGLETAAHDTDRTELTSTTGSPLQISWPKRLEELVRRTGTSSASTLDPETTQRIHQHLDALECIIGGDDPRPESAESVADASSGSRKQSQTVGVLGSVGSDISYAELQVGSKDVPVPVPVPEPVPEAVQMVPKVSTMSPHQLERDYIKKNEVLSQLQVLMSEVTALNEEINKRRKESNEIRDLFEERCRGLTRTVAELEDEVLELQSDLVEDSIELEGIQGTVRGLEDWIDGLREAQNMTRIARNRSRHEARRRWAIRGTSSQLEGIAMEADGEIVWDGLTAWMRGWRDVEEGFQIRSRARQLRREKRQEQLSRPREKKEETIRRSWATGS